MKYLLIVLFLLTSACVELTPEQRQNMAIMSMTLMNLGSNIQAANTAATIDYNARWQTAVELNTYQLQQQMYLQQQHQNFLYQHNQMLHK